MAFQQLYYTSCEHGLAGYSGYQFNAVTPGVSAAVMHEIEDRTVYEPPGWLLASPRPEEPEAYPVAFSHGTSEATGAVILAQVVFAGADYSGRPGNYFAHALVTDTPEQDFGPLLPVELWGAELWQRHPADRSELPELPGPPPPGSIDRAGTQAFLDAHSADGILPQLLTAVGKAMAGDRPVLLASHDVTENAWWIAAVSYLLGDHLGRRLTFTTYSHRPAYSPYHLTGVLPDALPPDADSSFQLFDLAAGRAPAERLHPLADLLASTGVLAASGLWQQAAAFAPGAGESLDDWLPPMTAAAGLLGRRLSAAETDLVAGWLLAAAGSMPVPLADAALGVTLSQPDEMLSDERLLGLLGMARQLPAADRAGRLEALLSERALAHLIRGEPALPVRLTGPAAAAAQARAVQVLGASTPGTALALLDWAAESGLVLPDADLERYGKTCLDPGTPEPELTSLLSGYPAILRGLLARLAGEPQAAETLFAGPAGGAIGRDDLAAYPALAELWLIQAAARGDIEPLRAFDEISDIRARRTRPARADGQLLRRLWPNGCPPEQLAELLGAVPGRPAADVRDWVVAQIVAVVARGKLDAGSLQLARALAGHPILRALPEADREVMQNAARVEPLLRLARSAVRRGDLSIFASLFAAYATVDDESRRLLESQVPVLLAEAKPLGAALRNCPPGMARAFCGAVTSWLVPERADVRLARRVFVALGDPDVLAQPGLAGSLRMAFEPVRDWRRRDLSNLARALADDGLAEPFQDWKDEQRSGLARKVFGAGREPLAGRGREDP